VVTRTNLAIRPDVKNSATNWFGPSGWARITSGVHATLPRTTAFAGSSAGDLQIDRSDVTAGQWVVYSVSIRFTAAQIVTTNIDWYAAGNVYLSTTTGNTYNQAGGTTLRVVSGVGQAPTNAVSARPNLTDFTGAAQVTGLLVETYATESDALAALAAHATAAHYFDGDGDGVGSTGPAYAWTGTNGSSVSTYTFAAPILLTAALASPVAHIVAQRHTTAVLAAVLASPRATIGLFVTVRYDEVRGRVRVFASGIADGVVRVVVSSRRLGTSRWTEVRGGRVGVESNSMVRTVDDYEFTSGEGVEYLIQALSSSEGQPDVIVQTRTAQVADTRDEVWVKFIATPYRNKRVLLHDWSAVARKSRVALYDVAGRPQPVAVTDVHTGRQFSVDLVAHTLADRDALDSALATGVPVFFQTPTSVPCPTVYAVIGDYSYKRPSEKSKRSVFTVQLIEISAPPPTVVGAGLTYAVLRTQYGSYADLAASVGSYQEIGA
jgi:hypothetical protein